MAQYHKLRDKCAPPKPVAHSQAGWDNVLRFASELAVGRAVAEKKSKKAACSAINRALLRIHTRHQREGFKQLEMYWRRHEFGRIREGIDAELAK